ncbi:hypothetical protein ACLOJK_026560 [Asimina triloba]
MFAEQPELIALEKALKEAMVPAGLARESEYGREVPLFEVDAAMVEPIFQRLYSFVFDPDSSGYSAMEMDRPLPSAIFVVNFDKVRMDPQNKEIDLNNLMYGKINPLTAEELKGQSADYIYRYRYQGGGASQEVHIRCFATSVCAIHFFRIKCSYLISNFDPLLWLHICWATLPTHQRYFPSHPSDLRSAKNYIVEHAHVAILLGWVPRKSYLYNIGDLVRGMGNGPTKPAVGKTIPLVGWVVGPSGCGAHRSRHGLSSRGPWKSPHTALRLGSVKGCDITPSHCLEQMLLKLHDPCLSALPTDNLRFETVDFTSRLLIPVIVLQNHNRYNILEAGHNYSIDMQAIEKEVRKMVYAGQEVVVVGGSHALHRHEKLAIAVSKAMRGHSIQETKNDGRFHVRTRTYLDGAILREEMERSADLLAAGLLDVADPSLTTTFFLRQQWMDESDGSQDPIIKHRPLWVSYSSKIRKEKKRSGKKKQGDQYRTYGTRVIPVFVLSLAGVDKDLLMEDESLVWTSKDVVIVLQHQNEKIPLSYVSETERRYAHPLLAQRHILAGLTSAVGGLSAPYEKASHVHERPIVNWLWATGCCPGKAAILSLYTTQNSYKGGHFVTKAFRGLIISFDLHLHKVYLMGCLRLQRSTIYARVDAALRKIRDLSEAVQAFAAQYLKTPLGEPVKGKKKKSATELWLEKFYKKTTNLPEPFPHEMVEQLEQYLDTLEEQLVDLSSLLYDHRLEEAHANSSAIFQSTIFTQQYVDRVLLTEKEKMKCCNIEYKVPVQSSQAFIYGGILIAGFFFFARVTTSTIRAWLLRMLLHPSIPCYSSVVMAGVSATSVNHPPSPPSPSNLFISLKTATQILDTKCHNSPRNLKETHAQIIKAGLAADNYVAGSLVKCYAASSVPTSLDIALEVFDHVQAPHAFLWNSIIRAFLDTKAPEKSISFYCRMVAEQSKPNKYTYPSLLKACTAAGAVAEGMQVHAHVVKHGLGGDKYIQSAGIQMYASFGWVLDARRLFDGSGEPDAVSWNAMIDGYFKFGRADAAVALFEQMPCRNVGSWNAVVTGYARCGRIEDSRRVFDEMPGRDEVSWSAMIDGYVQCGRFKEALGVFHEMQRCGIRLRRFLLSSVLAACASVGALDQGRWIHAYVERNSMRLDPVLGTALVDMYAKCGRLDMAWGVFGEMQKREVFEWNAMIAGLAMHGHAKEAIDLFSQMQAERLRPDNITFVGVLNACAHAGLAEEGRKYFDSMKEVHGLEPRVEHYGCLVDLLGRAGLLEEAEGVIRAMPMKPNAAVWGALLGACRIHGNVEVGEKVGKILLELEPHNSGRYALMSNMYAKAGRWEDVASVRKLMKERGIKTTPGSSSVDIDGVVHEFVMGDGCHPQMKEIRLMLGEMMERLRLEGYAPNTSEVLFNIDEEEKETALTQHSEKLAIAFGFLNTAPGTTIRVVKNLRVCEDCHSATKLMSRVYGREIVVRDRVRYHRFKDGFRGGTMGPNQVKMGSPKASNGAILIVLQMMVLVVGGVGSRHMCIRPKSIGSGGQLTSGSHFS